MSIKVDSYEKHNSVGCYVTGFMVCVHDEIRNTQRLQKQMIILTVFIRGKQQS